MTKNNISLISEYDKTQKGIMIVDDDQAFLILLSEYLKCWGYEIISVAHSGSRAIDIYETLESKPLIIITDYLMPNGDGLYLAKEIKKEYCEVILIMVTCDVKLTLNEVIKYGVSFLVKKLDSNFFHNLKNILESLKQFQE